MNSILDKIPQLPVAEAVEKFVKATTNNLSFLFSFLEEGGKAVMQAVTKGLLFIPPVVFIIIIAVLAFFATRKKIGLMIFSIVGLLFIQNQGLWDQLMNTITVVTFASFLSVLVGVPLGIWMAKNEIVNTIVKPILDLMQTMPAFVYLIPAVAFFGIGMVPGVFASIIFALPPVVRFTNLGIRQVPEEMVEAAESFGSTGAQKLFKVELPLAKPNIMAGINQTILLSLSMVVIASMIGAPGLGENVLSSLQRAQVGTGFVAGLSLVILAIIFDRLMQSLAE